MDGMLGKKIFFPFSFLLFWSFLKFLRYTFGWSMGSASCQREAYNLSHALHLHQNSLEPQSLNFQVERLSQHSWKKGLNNCLLHIFQTCVVKQSSLPRAKSGSITSNIIHTYLNILKVSGDLFWQCQDLNYPVNYAMNYALPAIGRPGPSKKNFFGMPYRKHLNGDQL